MPVHYITIDEELFVKQHLDKLTYEFLKLRHKNKFYISRPKENSMEYDGEKIHINEETLEKLLDICCEHDKIIEGHSLKEIIYFYEDKLTDKFNEGYEIGREEGYDVGKEDGIAEERARIRNEQTPINPNNDTFVNPVPLNPDPNPVPNINHVYHAIERLRQATQTNQNTNGIETDMPF